MCSLAMHTQDMTVNQATRFFMDHAYMEELPARSLAWLYISGFAVASGHGTGSLFTRLPVAQP